MRKAASFFSLRKVSQSPDQMLSTDMTVGHCWPMLGAKGYVVVQLREPIRPSHFALEHAAQTVVPDNTTTPKDIAIWVSFQTTLRVLEKKKS